MNLLWSICWQALRRAGHTAIVDDRRTLTYGQLLGAAMLTAPAIEAATARRHVGLLLPTSGAFPIALLGAWLAQRVAVPLNYLLSPGELRYVIQDSDIDCLLTVQPMLDFIDRSALPANVRIIRLEDVDFHAEPELRLPPLPDPDELAVLLYTSGTAGKPKGVMLTHGNLSFEVEAIIEHVGFDSSYGFLGMLPQFHSFGLTALTLLPLRMGCQVVYTARFVPRQVVQLIAQHRPKVIMAVPSMYAALLTVKEATPADFASVELAVSGGEPLPAAVFDSMQERLGVRLLEGYGLTETSPATNWSLPTHWRAGSVGPALPGVRQLIVDEHDQPLPAGAEGELLIAGPLVMKGYYKLPGETAAAFVTLRDPHDGVPRQFLRTGDIARIDRTGLLYITGRKKEMLIIGGENVFPREIEEALVQHPSVAAAAVVGRPDELRGETPIAFVERAGDAPFDEAALRAWCRQHLASYKVPREIRLLEPLPRNPTGKIMRRALPRD